MSRSREYTRKQRAHTIERKSKISIAIYGREYYAHKGSYSKNKVHCSCKMCRSSDCFGRHVLDKRELIAMDKMNNQMFELENEERRKKV